MNPQRVARDCWQQAGQRYGQEGRLLWLFLWVFALILIVVLIGAEKPWSGSPAQRLADGKNLRAQEWAVIGIWYGSLGALLATLPLLVGARWWLIAVEPSGHGRKPASEPASEAPERRFLPAHLPGGRLLWFGVLIAVITAGWLRAPRMDHSLWTDEEYVLRSYIHGGFRTNDDGELEFREATWNDALFTTKSGNNHLLHTIPARLSLDIWRWTTGEPREAFSETAVRLIPWLCGLLTIAAVAWLVVVVSGPGSLGVAAALTAAWLLALHPWHARWGVDARGYSLMLLCIILGWIALWQALKSNQRRWWIAYAAAQAGMLLAFPGAVYVAIIQNTAALGLAVGSRHWLALGRLLAANCITAIPVILLLAASVPQILGWLETENIERFHPGWSWALDLWSHVALGIPHVNPAPEYHIGTDLTRQIASNPVVASLVWRILPLFALVGCAAWLARGRGGIVIGLTMLLAPLLGYVHNAFQSAPMHAWYLLFALLLVVIAPPLALTHYLARIPKLAPLLLALLVLSYAWIAIPNNWLLRQNQRQPMRQTVEWIRQQDPDAVTAVFGTSDRQVLSYDPAVRILKSTEELDQFLTETRHQAVSSGQSSVYIYACGEWPGRARRPELMARLEQWAEQGLAAEVHRELALEAMFSYRVWRVENKPNITEEN